MPKEEEEEERKKTQAEGQKMTPGIVSGYGTSVRDAGTYSGLLANPLKTGNK